MNCFFEHGELLDIIDILFLKELSQSEKWNGIFYKLFELLIDIEKDLTGSLVYLYKQQFFFKPKGISVLEIWKISDLVINNAGNSDEIVIIFNEYQVRKISELFIKVTNCLKVNQVQYEIVNTEELLGGVNTDVLKCILLKKLT
ncbi:hypothetical protein IGI37_000247 [Enterococcus sp. AZ194]